MPNSTSFQDWENLVKKQLKTENIDDVLKQDNLEGLDVKPYYDAVSKPLSVLPKVEENTQFVSLHQEEWEQDSFAFLLNKNVEGLEDKTLFINSVALAEHIKLTEGNRYISLIDVFNEDEISVNQQLGKELLAKGFERSLCIDVSVHQNAGASVTQQIGIALAKFKELIEVFGLEIVDQVTFKVALGANYFFEIAKLRALKLGIYQLSSVLGLISVPYIFAETSMRNKSLLDLENNLIRSSLELSVGMIGGADALFSNDYRIENSTLLSQEISFKQQIVLAYESIINVFEDGANGSYYVEDLTQQIVSKAWNYFIDIEDNGGYLAELESGRIQKDIYQQAIAEQKWVEEGKIKLIGVNLYPTLEIKKRAEELYLETKIKPVRWAEAYE